MGILSKLKGVFYDEVVVDEDEKDNNKEELSKVNKIVRRETKEREIEEKPKIEEIKYKTIETEPEEDLVVEKPKTDNTFSERDLFKSDRTFDFDDENLNVIPVVYLEGRINHYNDDDTPEFGELNQLCQNLFQDEVLPEIRPDLFV